jgi:glucosyl-dolichyl phosphate glucuronosyltransferase
LIEADTLHDFSVILCAYTEDRWEDLLKAVQSVRQQTRPPLEVILVVDHNPALYERACGQFPDISVLENEEAPGLSGSRNTGLRIATGTYVAFLDEDAQAAPDWLQQLQSGYSDPDVAGVGGFIEPMWDTGRPDWFPEEFYWVVGCSYRGLPEERAPVRNLIGANMSFRRDLFSATGGFRSGIGRIGRTPVGCEETELCIRARQRSPGNILLYLPDARVMHRVPASRSNWRYFLARCYAEGMSKALVTHFVGARDGLQSERTHMLRVLPQGVWRGLSNGLRRKELGGFLRAFAIIVGLGATTAGYLAGSVSQRLARPKHRPPDLRSGVTRTNT